MPELPEVEITRIKLLPRVRGRNILDFWTDWPRGLRAYSGKRTPHKPLRDYAGQVAGSMRWVAADMRGRKILDIARRGKVLFFRLSGTPRSKRSPLLRGKPERVMAIHLRMSGRLEMALRPAKRHPDPERSEGEGSLSRWTHFSWQLSGNRELKFIDPRKFGVVWYGAPGELKKDPYLGGLGIDARNLAKKAFITALRRHRGMLKPLLLRQNVVAGIGNILADESLWHAGIHPQAGVAGLGDAALGRLHGGLQKTIRIALASGGTSMRNFRHPDGDVGRYQERRLAYGSAGRPCPRCRTTLERLIVGGRGTTVCPACQRLES